MEDVKDCMVEMKINVAIPKEATYDQVVEWLKYSVGYTSEIYLANPLCDEDMEALSFEIVK